jgi:single-stranded-DNA-specific exonuclease
LRRPDPPWTVRPPPEDALAAEIPALARRLGVPVSVARILWMRGHREEGAARRFLSPRLADLESPERLPDARRAAERIARAVRAGERIAVYGDYDVDGMTGTAILLRFLTLAGADAIWEIPDRDADGYGLGPAAVDRLAARGTRLILTVDNGVSSHVAIARANALGIDTVVTDHHLPGASLPPAHAVVNPNRGDGDGSGATLCGCTLALKTAWAVAERLRSVLSDEQAGSFRAFLRDAVGLAAVATISDVMPLLGENRTLVAAGLTSLAASENPGIRALLHGAGVGGRRLTTQEVAFRLAPRINAAGRLSRPEVVVELLTTADAARARALAGELERANETRRGIEKGVLEQAVRRAEVALAAGGKRSLVVHGDGWHRGVIGIVAARLVDIHARPAVVIGMDGDSGRGSCRSRSGVDLHRALSACGPHLERYGGHAMAAGLEIRRAQVDRFAEAFEEAVRGQEEITAPGDGALALDGESVPEEWDLSAVEALERLAPFGPGNPEPTFLFRSVRVAGKPRLLGSSGDHIAFALQRPGAPLRVVGFRRPDLHELASCGAPLDLAAVPSVNEWKGTRSPELRLVALRPTPP